MATKDAHSAPVCANCQSPGDSACKGCLLITYCGKDCQVFHWKIHKDDCKSPLKQQDWKPQWVQENRNPAFVGDAMPAQVIFGSKKFLCGNMPGVDIARLETNEGKSYDQELKLLFAASGDLRNVIKTVASLPTTYLQKSSVVINDIDFDIVARNAIMLLLALTVEDHQEAAEAILHCWYSACIRPQDREHLLLLRPIIEDVCQKVSGRAAGSLQAKTFAFGNNSLRLILKKENWETLLDFFSIPTGLTVERAHAIRTAVTKAHQRVDYRQRALITQQPEHRVCKEKFWEDGILAPFSQSTDDFKFPNPTFYRATEWPMMDSADPLSGWDFTEILKTNNGSATNDLYGKLSAHILATLLAFIQRLSSVGASFELYHMNAIELPAKLTPASFARIEVSKISDMGYLGLGRTLSLFGPLLQKPADNPHATMLTLFMNAVKEADNAHASASDNVSKQAEMATLMQYRSFRERCQAHPVLAAYLMMGAVSLAQDVEKLFTMYCRSIGSREVARKANMKAKHNHTVVEKWPTRLKLRPGQVGADEELRVAMASTSSNVERYVEWVRTD